MDIQKWIASIQAAIANLTPPTPIATTATASVPSGNTFTVASTSGIGAGQTIAAGTYVTAVSGNSVQVNNMVTIASGDTITFSGYSWAQTAAILSQMTNTLPAQNTNGLGARNVLYMRFPVDASGNPSGPSSFERFLSAGSGLVAITPAAGYTSGQIVTLCQALSMTIQSNDSIQTSIPSVALKVQSDLSILMKSKLSDGKGILWDAGELTPTDPGDGVILAMQLIYPTIAVFDPAPSENDIQSIMTITK